MLPRPPPRRAPPSADFYVHLFELAKIIITVVDYFEDSVYGLPDSTFVLEKAVPHPLTISNGDAVFDELAYYADCAAEEHWSRAALVKLKNLVHDDTTWDEVFEEMKAFPWEETRRSGSHTIRAGAPRSSTALRAMATRKGWKKKYNSKARISREEHARVVAERDELSRQVARLTAQLAAATARDVDH